MAPVIQSLLLIAATLSTVLALPADPTTPYHPPQYQPAPISHHTHTITNPLILLRDVVIRRIWGLPQRLDGQPVCDHKHPTLSSPPDLRVRYSGDVVLRFRIKKEDEAEALSEISDILYLDVWESTDEWVDIRMAKDIVPSVLSLLPPSLHNSYTPLMHDLAQTVHESYPTSSSDQQSSIHPGFTPSVHGLRGQSYDTRELFFQEYQPLSVIFPWMRLMASLFPTHVRMINIGYSYEGREIPALRVGVHPTNHDKESSPRKTVIVSGGSHAREWISTSTVTYIAYSLITRYGKFHGITKLLDELDFVFIPTMNPDGYVYTWDTDRLWRKNRQQTNLRLCPGVDLDRAWGYEWDGESSRSNPCSESYAGGGPFEGVEARSLANWARNQTQDNDVTFVGFLDLHSYSQQVLYPYSYSCAVVPPSLEDLQELAMGLAKAFRLTNNHFYGVGSACEGSITAEGRRKGIFREKIEQGGGSALDWFYHEMGIKYAFQIKLRDTGSYGFLLPKGYIVPTGQETFNAVLALGKFLLGDKGIEVELEKEFIMRDEKHGNVKSQESGEIPDESETLGDDGDVYNEEEDDWTTELRRRRRKR